MKRIVFIFLVSISVFPVTGQTDCILQKDQDSVKVYTCRTNDSKFKAIKALFTVNTSLANLQDFILDIKGYTEWQYNTIESTVLKIVNANELVYYSAIHAPWPVADRDMVVRLKIIHNPRTKDLVISTNSEPNLIPVKTGRVRVPTSKATWVIKQQGVEKLSVEYFIEIDPGGSVPAWMVNMVCAEAPYVSFKNLRDKIGKH